MRSESVTTYYCGYYGCNHTTSCEKEIIEHVKKCHTPGYTKEVWYKCSSCGVQHDNIKDATYCCVSGKMESAAEFLAEFCKDSYDKSYCPLSVLPYWKCPVKDCCKEITKEAWLTHLLQG